MPEEKQARRPGAIIDARAGADCPDTVSPETRLAGLSLLARAILAAGAAGLHPVVLLDDRLSRLPDAPRLPADMVRAQVREVPRILDEFPSAARWLVLPVRTVVDPGCLGVLAAHAGDSTARVVPHDLDGNPAPSGSILFADTEQILTVLGRGASQQEALQDVPAPEDALCLALCDRSQLEEAESRFLLHVSRGAETDGWVDRVFNRRISRAFTRLILNTPVAPNQVTLLHVFLGLLAAACLAVPEYGWGVAGALLFQLSVALDCSDGELARLKLQFSRWGGMLDVVGDNVVHAAIFLGIGVATQQRFGTLVAVGLGACAALGILLAFLTVWWLTEWQKRRWAEGKPAGYALAPVAANHALVGQAHGGPPPTAARLDAWISELTSRDFSVLIMGAALLGHPEWMLWLAAVGAHLFWLGFLGVQIYFFRRSPAAAA